MEMQSFYSLPEQQVHGLLGQRLRHAREQKGLSLSDASFRSGLGVRELGEIEQGGRRIYASHIAALSRCYEITPNELFLGLAHTLGVQVNESDLAHLMQKFLKIDHAGRGDLFKGLVASIAARDGST